MAKPRLSYFISPAPTSLISNPPSLWLEDCLAGGTEHLVLVDNRGTPVQVLPLNHLLSIAEHWTAPPASAPPDSASPQQPPKPGLPDRFTVSPSLLSIRLSPDTAARMVAAAPTECWIVVDQQQRYVGLLDKVRLLALMLTQHAETQENWPDAPSVLPAAPAQESDRPPFSQQQISESNTALLTYLGHELKTPLTSLLGLASLLGTERLGQLNTRQARYLSLIQQHCRRLTAWVNTLIDLGRIDGGTLRIMPQMLDLAPIWQEAYHQAALRVGKVSAQSVVLPPPLQPENSPLQLVADPLRMKQMLTCLMQPALATLNAATADLPIQLEIWDNWVAFISQKLEDDLCLDYLSQSTFRVPFPATPPATPIAAEHGHWLEWLLVRKLAQLHRGELVLMSHAEYGVCPVLLLPITPPLAWPSSGHSFVLLVAPAQPTHIQTLQQQIAQLDYQLLITHGGKDVIEVAAHIPISVIFVLIEGPESVKSLSYLTERLSASGSQTVALVPPRWSSLLGELPADRELLWPTDSLGEVLSQPLSVAPPPNRITVLYLKNVDQNRDSSIRYLPDYFNLPGVFHNFGCRVLEVDDLEQAALLRRVWHPDVAVIAPDMTVPTRYFQTLSQFPELTSLPLITLTEAITQAARGVDTLTVFPCLLGEAAWDRADTRDRMAAWLVHVLQMAAAHGQAEST